MRRPSPAAFIAFLALVSAMGGFAFAANEHATTSAKKKIKSCYAKKTGELRVTVKGKRNCRRSEKKLVWNRRGLRGPAGARGLQGPAGQTGAQGLTGPQGPAGLSGGGGGGVTLGPGTVGSEHIAAGSITAAKIAPGAVNLSALGLQLVYTESAADSISPKTVSAGCPPGKTVIAGGAGTYEGLGVPFTGPVALSFSNASIGNAWTARAYETSATGSNWRLTVYAYCISAG